MATANWNSFSSQNWLAKLCFNEYVVIDCTLKVNEIRSIYKECHIFWIFIINPISTKNQNYESVKSIESNYDLLQGL